jgi:hypothetical protein
MPVWGFFREIEFLDLLVRNELLGEVGHVPAGFKMAG